MTNPNNWPDPAKPGAPLNPERDGWHWLKHPEDLHPVMMGWLSELQGWSFGRRHSPKGIVDMGYQYLGPTLLPAEVAAQVEQARREGAEAMREEAAQYLLTLSASSPRWGSPEEHAEAIRALPAKEVTDV